MTNEMNRERVLTFSMRSLGEVLDKLDKQSKYETEEILYWLKSKKIVHLRLTEHRTVTEVALPFSLI